MAKPPSPVGQVEAYRGSREGGHSSEGGAGGGVRLFDVRPFQCPAACVMLCNYACASVRARARLGKILGRVFTSWLHVVAPGRLYVGVGTSPMEILGNTP